MELTKEDIAALESWISPRNMVSCLAEHYSPIKNCSPFNHRDGTIACDTACVELFPETADTQRCPCNIHGKRLVKEAVRDILKAHKD